jgi:ferredoxin
MSTHVSFWSRVKHGLAHFAAVSPSTRLFWRMSRAAGKPWWQFVHGYVYARWPFAYIGSALAERRELRRLRVLFAPFLLGALWPRQWAEEYHGKVIPTAMAARLVTVHEDLILPQPQEAIPFSSARDLILTNPGHIVALDCPCRMARLNPCLPLDVCLIVGDPFAGFILEHHPQHARAITQGEAVAILEAEALRGHVHHAFFKRAMLDRFYAICNCCSCCCGAMQAQRNDTPMLISSGYVSHVAEARCQACGKCAEVCPFEAIHIQGHALVDSQVCMGCGVCVKTCPNGVLQLVLDQRKPVPLVLPG